MKVAISFFISFCLTLFSCSSSTEGRRIGVDPSWYPLQYGSRDSNITAFSTGLLTEIGKDQNIPFVKVTVSWDVLMEGLQKGEYEGILSSMPPYIFNENQFDFSDVYLPLGPVLVVPIDSKINSLNMLQGKEIAVVLGSSYNAILEKAPGVLIRYIESIAQGLQEVIDNSVDGAIVDILTAAAYCNDLYRGQLKIATPPLNDDGLRLITKHEKAPDLIKGFNKGLQKLKKNGTYDSLLIKWSLQE